MDAEPTVLQWLTRLLLLTIFFFHGRLLWAALQQPGPQVADLLQTYPAPDPNAPLPLITWFSPGASFFPLAAFSRLVSFVDDGLLAIVRGQQMLVPWKHLRLFGKFGLLVVVEVVPEKTKFFMWRHRVPWYALRQMKKADERRKRLKSA